MRYAAKNPYFQQVENHNFNEMTRREFQKEVDEDRNARLRYESDVRSSCRRKRRIQKQADKEFLTVENIYNTEKKKEKIKTDKLNMDAIAHALKRQKESEICDEKNRQGLRENSPEIRELMVKLRTAIINQNLDNQIHEKAKKEATDKMERLMEEEQVLKKDREAKAKAEELERAKMEELRSYRELAQQQLEERNRRRKLLAEAERINDKELMMEAQRKNKEEWIRQETERREKMQRQREEIEEFIKQREKMKELERLREEEEKRRIENYKHDVDERLNRAIEEQKRRDAEREKITENLAAQIQKDKREREDYEQLVIDLAEEKELERLKQREIEEAEKIRKQHEEIIQYMKEHEEAKRKKMRLSEEEDRRLKLQIAEDQKKLAELAELEQEKNRLRIDNYRRELARQLVEKRKMYEAARQAELFRIKLEQEREARRQEMIEEERRKLVVNHILKMGPESIKYLPKGVLREDDLNYLPQVYRDAIFKSGNLEKIL